MKVTLYRQNRSPEEKELPEGSKLTALISSIDDIDLQSEFAQGRLTIYVNGSSASGNTVLNENDLIAIGTTKSVAGL